MSSLVSRQTKTNCMLPTGSLVPFATRRLANASNVFVNRDFDPDYGWLDRYAYLIPSVLETPDCLHDEHKTFFAERYGGPGALHGGGVRCGLDAEYHVKGIGCNLLAGDGVEKSNFWHSHGGVALVDAIQEAAWGEVFHHSLPYGAVRIPALILTGTECWFEGANGARSKVPRALVVRENALRPAHFERAAFFRPRSGVQIPSDMESVCAAVQYLPDVLPLPDTLAAKEAYSLTKIERLHIGTMEMARHLAVQCATAQAKRLMHGSINSSNVSLDGRWLDYGTATALPNYANTKTFGLPRSMVTFWEEQNSFAPTLVNLCFYIGKYFPTNNKSELPQAPALQQFFIAHYQNALMQAFVRLAGFPEVLLSALWSKPDVQRLAQSFITIARGGVEKPFSPAVIDLEMFGKNRLGQVLLVLARWHNNTACDARLVSLLPAASMRNTVISAYRAVVALFSREAAAYGIGAAALRKLCLLNAAKSAKNIPSLFRHNMAQHCSQLLNSHSDGASLRCAIQSWVDDLGDQACVVYQDPKAFMCLFWKSGQTRIYFDAMQHQWRVEEAGQISWLPWVAVGSSAALAAMRDYWGNNLWEIVDGF